jgi:hypothetical protein
VQGQAQKPDRERFVQKMGDASMIEVLKQALDALEKSQSALAEELSAWDFDSSLHHIQESHDLCGPAITAIKEAIREHAMYEVQRLGQEIEQEPVAWVQDVEFEQLPEFAFSWVKTRLHDKPLYTHPPQHTEQNFCPRCGKRTNDIHTCTPPQRTEQEPVAYWKEHAQGLQHDYDSLLAEFQAQRTWVGLTDEEHSKCWHSNPDKAIKNIEAKLKEKNNA